MLDRERGRGSMAASMKFMIFMCIFTASASIQLVLGQSTKCFPQSTAFINDLQLQCPQTISPSSPIEVNGFFSIALNDNISPFAKWIIGGVCGV